MLERLLAGETKADFPLLFHHWNHGGMIFRALGPFYFSFFSTSMVKVPISVSVQAFAKAQQDTGRT